jgi:hypothetical protein
MYTDGCLKNMTNTTIITHHNEKRFINTIGNEHSKRIQDQIDEIRLVLYEETEKMTEQEIYDLIGKEIVPILEQLGLNPVSRIIE